MVEQSKNVSCESCGSEILKQVYVVKEVSALVAPDGKQTFIPVPVFACNKCDHVNNIFVSELKLSNSPLIKP